MLPQEFHVISEAYARRDQHAIQLKLKLLHCGSETHQGCSSASDSTSSSRVSSGTSGVTITTSASNDEAPSAPGLDRYPCPSLSGSSAPASTADNACVPSTERMQTLKIEFAEAFRAECDARSLRRRDQDDAPPGHPKLVDHWGDMNDAEKDALVTYMVGRLPKNQDFDPVRMAQVGCYSVMADLARYQTRKERKGKPKRKKIDSQKWLKDSLTNEIYVKYGVFSPHQWSVKHSKEIEEKPEANDEVIIVEAKPEGEVAEPSVEVMV